ncbi:hypothetical protein Bealeia1_01691 [Candidatus Bealeia paramacronuclearis]|uniref:Uncharacterized protein n=1 Tax=Candidatus Bealeia paramacronuclearis TaxID=1921001 RepID=A0ABZ2C8I0_9PROT
MSGVLADLYEESKKIVEGVVVTGVLALFVRCKSDKLDSNY